MMRSGRKSSSARSTLSLSSLKVSRRFCRASSRSVWIAEICSLVVIVSIAIACVAIRSASDSTIVVIAGDQVHDESGDGAAQRDSSDDGQECEPDAAFGAAAEDEAEAAGDRQRGQRL